MCYRYQSIINELYFSDIDIMYISNNFNEIIMFHNIEN